MLQLAAFQGGHLRLTSDLTTANGVVSLLLGHPNAALGSDSGTVELFGNNTYTGGTALTHGMLALGNSSVFNSGTLISGPLGTGTLTVTNKVGLARLTPSSDLTVGNAINLNGTDAMLKLTGSDSYRTILAGLVSGTGQLVVDTNAQFTQPNTYSGGTVINSGTLSVARNLGLGSGAVEVRPGGTLQFPVGVDAPVVTNLVGGSGSLIQLSAGTALTINSTAPTDFAGDISGIGGRLIKTGTANLRLSGYNTYDGGTTISAGTLIAGSDDALGTGTVTLAGGRLGFDNHVMIPNAVAVGAGSRLQGNATISGPVTLATGAVVAPGNSVGTLYFGSSLTWAGGASFDFEVQKPLSMPGFGYDTINVSSTLSLTATPANPFVVNLISLTDGGALGALAFDPTLPYSWQLATASSITGFDPSVLSLNPAAFTTTNPFSGSFSFALGSGGNGSTLLLNFTPVPEPRTWILLLLGLLPLLARHLRRRKE